MAKGNWTVKIDVQVTRRKRFHFVIDPEGKEISAHGKASEAFAQAKHLGLAAFDIDTPDFTLEVSTMDYLPF